MPSNTATGSPNTATDSPVYNPNLHSPNYIAYEPNNNEIDFEKQNYIRTISNKDNNNKDNNENSINDILSVEEEKDESKETDQSSSQETKKIIVL